MSTLSAPGCRCGAPSPDFLKLQQLGFSGPLLEAVGHILAVRECSTGNEREPQTASPSALPVVLAGDDPIFAGSSNCVQKSGRQLLLVASSIARFLGDSSDQAIRAVAAFFAFLQMFRGSPYAFVTARTADEERGLCEMLTSTATGRDGVDRRTAQCLIRSEQHGTLKVAVVRHPQEHARVLKLTLSFPGEEASSVHMSAKLLAQLPEVGSDVQRLIALIAVHLGKERGNFAEISTIKSDPRAAKKSVRALVGLGMRYDGSFEDLSEFAMKLQGEISRRSLGAFDAALA